MGAVYRRELLAYFSSPVGYVFLSVFYLFIGYFFTITISMQSSQLNTVFSGMLIIVVCIVPVLTMRLMSDDKKQKTDQLLLTSPISLTGQVYGKFLAAMTIFAAGTGLTFVFGFIISCFTPIDWPVLFGNIAGMLLLGASLISIGMFISSMTESQAVSAVGSFAVLLLFILLDSIASFIPIAVVSDFVYSLAVGIRYGPFTTGIFDVSNLLYFLSVMAIFNFMTVRVLEKKRWS